MGSNSDVSAFFRLRFRNGLGTKPAGVLPFRMRVPNTFFLSLAWWLAGFQVLRCAKVCLAWGDFFFFVFSRFQKQRFGSFLAAVSALFLAAVSHGLGIYFLLSNGFQQRRFGIFPATVSQWLGHKTCCASPTPFSWVWPGGLSDVSAFFRLRFRNGLGTKPAGVLPFRMRVPNTFFLSLVWWLAGFQVLRFVFSRFQKQRFALSLFGIFRRFHKQRFGSFLAAVSHGLGIYISFFLMGSNSDVSAFFRLRFRNGLGTKPAGVLPFRMRVPNTFFLSLAWWLAGFFFVFSRVQKQRFGSFLAAVSHGLGPISFSFKWVPTATFRHFSGYGFAMAGVLPFRMRVPNTFFLSLAWWLAGLFACASLTPFSCKGLALLGYEKLQASKSYVAQRFALLEATFFLCF